jgi:enamine deaminase RidA (YjgF/YER057c/UK114 family)
MSQPRSQGAYVVATRHQDLVYTAGLTPRIDGTMWRTGRLGRELSDDDARECVRIAVRNAIAAIRSVATGQRIDQILRMTVFLACDEHYTAHTSIADAAADVFEGTLAQSHSMARLAIGVSSLPSGAPVEVELTALLSPSSATHDHQGDSA